jgi:hypothetical protein
MAFVLFRFFFFKENTLYPLMYLRIDNLTPNVLKLVDDPNITNFDTLNLPST